MNSGVFRERLLDRAGLAHVTLTIPAIERLETYYFLLSRWNKRINLTALPLDSLDDRALDRMLVEPLVAAKYMRDSAIDWFDLGSGGGSPAIPMKIVRPSARLTLVEARSRKAAFLREVARELTLSDVLVIADRFETTADRPELVGSADLVTVRAVRTDAALFGAARRLARADAELHLFAAKGAPTPASALFGLTRSVELVPGGQSELLILAPKLLVPRGTQGET